MAATGVSAAAKPLRSASVTTMACENGWQLFMDMMVGLADIWFLLLCGVGLWWYIRYRKCAGARAGV